MKKFVSVFSVLIFVGVVLYVFGHYWSYIFAKSIVGEVVKVEKLMDPVAIITRGADPSNKIFSFAVAIKDKATGEIFTASTEDRQWAAVAGENLCAEAKFFPYPPWKLDKAGTYFGARLIRLWNCGDKKPE